MFHRCILIILVVGVAWSALAAEDDLRLESVTTQIALGEQGCTVELTLEGRAKTAVSLTLIGPDALLTQLPELPAGADLVRDATGHHLRLTRPGAFALRVAFRVATPPEQEGWRVLRLDTLAGSPRHLRILADRADVEIELPGAVQVQRKVIDDRAQVAARLGPGLAAIVRWRPRPQDLDGDLVATVQTASVVSVVPGALRLDMLATWQISQGRLLQAELALDDEWEVVSVAGSGIRAWRVDGQGEERRLRIDLVRPARDGWTTAIHAERLLPVLPARLSVSAIEPVGIMRGGGELLVGTDSNMQVAVRAAGGLNQIEASALTLITNRGPWHAVPKTRAYAYRHAAAAWQMELHLAELISIVDVREELRLHLRDDDAVLEAQLGLEVREAPLRRVRVRVPAGWTVVGSAGTGLEDDRFTVAGEDDDRICELVFTQPLLGPGSLRLRLERGRSPIGDGLELSSLAVEGAASQRGWIAVSADAGLDVSERIVTGLRAVATALLPQRVPGARLAWRGRDADWRLGLEALRRQPGIRAESFHLLALGDGVCHGAVALTYLITGAAVDALSLAVPEGLHGVEVVGADVLRVERAAGVWTVRLRRRVSGDYNLALAFTQPLADGQEVLVGGMRPLGVEAHDGWAVVASHRDVRLQEQSLPDGMLPARREELPEGYRLMVTAPILGAWRLGATGEPLHVRVSAYERVTALETVIDLVEIDSAIERRADGGAETLHTISMQVKNAGSQFLDLRLPSGARLLSGPWIEADGQERVRARVLSDGDGLKIALPRLRDPDSPITVIFEYAQAYERAAALSLVAPATATPQTAVLWRLTTADSQALLVRGGSVSLPQQAPGPNILSTLATAWLSVLRHPVLAMAGILALVLLALHLLRPMAFTGPLAGGALAIVSVLAGLLASLRYAASSFSDYAIDRSQLVVSQIIATSDSAPHLELALVPAWLAELSWSHLGLAGLALVLALVLAWRMGRRPVVRAIAVALALFGLVLLLEQSPVTRPAIAHLLTWGLGAVLGGMLIATTVIGRVRRLPSALVLAALLLLVGACGGRPPPPLPGDTMVQQVAVTCRAADDHMLVDLRLELLAGEGGELVIPVPGALFDNAPLAPRGVRVDLHEGGLRLRQDAGISGVVSVRLVLPLAPADANGRRTFSLDLPLALSNTTRVQLTDGDQRIVAPGALWWRADVADDGAYLDASFAHGAPARFIWRPRPRDRSREQAVFTIEAASRWLIAAGVAEGRHELQVRLAQGEISGLELDVDAGETVTAVTGPGIATWAFDAAEGRLRVRLERPLSGDGALIITSQRPLGALPGEVSLGQPRVRAAERQRGVVAALAGEGVLVRPLDRRLAIDAADLHRQAPQLLPDPDRIVAGWRVASDGGPMTLAIDPIAAELRVQEQSRLSLGDERAVWNGHLRVQISRAGLFALEVMLPSGWDLDAVESPQLAHWDDQSVDDGMALSLHLRGRLTGVVDVHLALSRPLPEDGTVLAAPAVRLSGARAHGGHMTVVSEPGLRATVHRRIQASEVDVRSLGLGQDHRGAIGFRLLGPDRLIELALETIAPLIQVETLHALRIDEGVSRHRESLRVNVRHAGIRDLVVDLPERAQALVVTGADIASWQHDGQQVRVELGRRLVDEAWTLRLDYEIHHPAAAKHIRFTGSRVRAADLQRGWIAVEAGGRLEVSARPDPAWQAAEPRSLPGGFGLGDLGDAVLCVRTLSAAAPLELDLQRHATATLAEADIRQFRLHSVVSGSGVRLHHVELRLLVGERRHLALGLGDAAQVWSLAVDGRSLRAAVDPATGRLLIPLAHAAAGEMESTVTMVWMEQGDPAAPLRAPSVDLPLRDVQWLVYLPDDQDWRLRGGTITVLAGEEHLSYDADDWRNALRRRREEAERSAKALVISGQQMAHEGRQYAARAALESAFNRSLANVDLNEDARVQLAQLNSTQAVVGLYSRRNSLRRASGETALGGDLGEGFRLDEAQRLRASLDREDGDNLQRISGLLVQVQEQAAGDPAQLGIILPRRGRVLTATSALVAEPEADLHLDFEVQPRPQISTAASSVAQVPVLLVLILLIWASIAIGRSCGRVPSIVAETEADDEANDDKDLTADLDRLAAAVPAPAPDATHGPEW